jgi:hypothetical protein
MAKAQILNPVGRGGLNRRDDVILVQELLTKHGYSLGRQGIDGACGPMTIAAILEFQRRFLRCPDGLIHVGGMTWNRLTGTVAPPPSRKPISNTSPPKIGPHETPPEAELTTTLTKLLPKPDPATINIGLSAVSNKLMLELFGNPRETYSQEDQPVTNESLKKHVVTESVGPFRTHGLKPAVASLREVMAVIEKEQSAVYSHISSAGMLVCRYQRGSTTTISNHSWGCAIDLKINGVLDSRGDNKVQHGLTLIAPIFNRFGWYWGAAFPKEDGMHFEGSRTLVQQWKQEAGI